MSSISKSPRKVRFGIMCYGTTFSRWQAETIQALLESPYVEPALLIVDVTHLRAAENVCCGVLPKLTLRERILRLLSEKPFMWRARRKIRERLVMLKTQLKSKWLWSFYWRVRAVRGKPYTDQKIDLSESLEHVRRIECSAQTRGKFSQYFSDQDVAAIKGHELDFIIRFAYNIIRGDILSVATNGVWSFHHDDPLKYRGSPPGFWEIYYGDKQSGSILQSLSDILDDGSVMIKDEFPTQMDSYLKNRSQLWLGTVEWPAIAARALVFGADKNSLYLNEPRSQAHIFKAPSNHEMAYFLMKTTYFRLRECLLSKASKKSEDVWAIGLLRQPVGETLRRPMYGSVEWIESPEGRWFADPFVFEFKGKACVFFEDYHTSQKRGNISYLPCDDLTAKPKRVLGEDGLHYSYPYMFSYQGEVYMLPEVFESGQTRLYRASAYPDKWVLDRVLFDDLASVDPIIYQQGNLWWLWIGDGNEAQSEVRIFTAVLPFGPWKEHPSSPLCLPFRARNAGNLIQCGKRLFRPTQDSYGGYGKRIVLREVTQMTLDTYEEIDVCYLRSFHHWPYPDGMHTIAHSGNLTVIDGKRNIDTSG